MDRLRGQKNGYKLKTKKKKKRKRNLFSLVDNPFPLLSPLSELSTKFLGATRLGANPPPLESAPEHFFGCVKPEIVQNVLKLQDTSPHFLPSPAEKNVKKNCFVFYARPCKNLFSLRYFLQRRNEGIFFNFSWIFALFANIRSIILINSTYLLGNFS